MKTRPHKLLIPLFLFMLSQFVYGQTATIGRVLDFNTDSAIANVKISGFLGDSSVRSNSLGFFEVPVKDTVELSASAKGYLPSTFKVSEGKAFKIRLYKKVKLNYDGGEDKFYEYVGRNLLYPPSERERQIQARVLVSFQLDSTGNIINIKPLNDKQKNFNKEVIRVLEKAHSFKPVKTTVNFVLPVIFAIGGMEKKLSEQVNVPSGQLLNEVVVVAYDSRTVGY